MNAHQILVLLIFLFAVLGIIKPSWPFLSLAVLLIAVDLLIYVKLP